MGLARQGPAGLPLSIFLVIALFFLSFANALAYPNQISLGHATKERGKDEEPANKTLHDLIGALHAMQDNYFQLWLGTWPTAIDWTAAVLNTHVAATLASLTDTAHDITPSFRTIENTINHFFSHTSTFYFGENSFGLRQQAYDDMLWVVLDWLENIKFQDLHSNLHYTYQTSSATSMKSWYGTQFRDSAAHRARLFWELASLGWDKTLCDGGMVWSPYLGPYKNAITNELYISASIGMYLYFPGDPIESPFIASQDSGGDGFPHDPAHLKAAVDGYAWLKHSNMTGPLGLYGDGFHISGWKSAAKPGTKKCDLLNTMAYTYNQGVLLSGLRGLWLATGDQDYFRDGHELIYNVMRATGWPQTDSQQWAGLGRGGVLEDVCDSRGVCNQDGQTFKGIFFHHLAEFCRPLRPQEERFLVGDATRRRSAAHTEGSPRDEVYGKHLERCRSYGGWIEHNAKAALMTRDDDGKFGAWWGREYGALGVSDELVDTSVLPAGAVDYRSTILSDLPLSSGAGAAAHSTIAKNKKDYNDRGRGRTVETQSGGVAVLRALYQWQTCDSLS
ncbi:hypothetical protein N7474_009907 [Penicillium riverlandense]|uniref:uncharacterized protein n=1 Tax=Penicillium riverlandense TaxID=1903569 RepID=UPI0025469BFA|nr:uncharacterized protein N7474_009907 [Penicillium riverlandense]KAJ5808638.1 hypothetical protein N7474_009907 [Penicillium riverlandense]